MSLLDFLRPRPKNTANIARERFKLIEFRRCEFTHLAARRAAGVAYFEDALQVVELETDRKGGADESHAFNGESRVFAIAVRSAPRLEQPLALIMPQGVGAHA